MKKIVFALMLGLSVMSFAAKLTTDKKPHWEKIRGKWYAGIYTFTEQKGRKFLIIDDTGTERSVLRISQNGYIFKDQTGVRYAWDTKLRTVVTLDAHNNIETKFSKNMINAN